MQCSILTREKVCTCPSRALIQESIYDKFMEKAIARTKAVKQDNPLKMETMIGAQASLEQMEKIKSYLNLVKKKVLKSYVEEVLLNLIVV